MVGYRRRDYERSPQYMYGSRLSYNSPVNRQRHEYEDFVEDLSVDLLRAFDKSEWLIAEAKWRFARVDADRALLLMQATWLIAESREK